LSIPDQRPFAFDWVLWFQWMLATSVGWVLGRFLLPNLAFVVIGIAMGIMQWFVLKDRVRNSVWWIIATTVGWLLGSTIAMFLLPDGSEFLAGLLIGTTTGIAQWLILKSELYLAGWWVIASIIAWTTGLFLLPGLFLSGVMAGVITGFALALLMNFPKPEPGQISEVLR
jgi:hypothetical protein